jgi:hypothetical protein
MYALVDCPYCGVPHSLTVDAHEGFSKSVIVNCMNNDDEGCAREFVFSYTIKIDTKTRRIEGEMLKELEESAAHTCANCKHVYVKDFYVGACENLLSIRTHVEPDDTCEWWEEREK